MKPYFIIGTDTDCGKTYVTCALMRYFQAQQKTVMALKPVVSGCERQENVLEGDVLISEDVTRLQATQGDKSTMISPWMFPLPVSPHLAAQAEGVELHSQSIVSFCQKETWNAYDYLLIEGAGGLMVPLNHHETWVDVLQQLNIPVILVVGIQLGCINHALLTVTALQHYGIACAGWIANCLKPETLCLEENIQTLEQKITFPLLARVAQDGDLESWKVGPNVSREVNKCFFL